MKQFVFTRGSGSPVQTTIMFAQDFCRGPRRERGLPTLFYGLQQLLAAGAT